MYAELLARTHYSFLRGSSHPSEMVEHAAQLKLAALGVCDRDGVYGIPKAYRASKDHPGLKLITGAELTLTALPRLNLLAINRAGYGLMCRLLTASHAGQSKGEASLDWKEFAQITQSFGDGLQGLIAIPDLDWSVQIDWEFYSSLQGMFLDRMYLPMSRYLDGHDRQREEMLFSVSQRLKAPLIATNQPHCHSKERTMLQDVMTCIRENSRLDESGFNIFPNGEHYLKSPQQMKDLFKTQPEALTETLRLAERCTFSPGELRYFYPSERIPPGETAQSHLEKTTYDYAQKRYPDGIPVKVEKQLREEFALIEKKNYADYFLTIWEIVEFARTRKILCQGRGSAANSVVCYCLGITAIDPVAMSLLFARFISDERDEPPDIDVDFEHERREEVIQHIYEKYGRHHTGMVAALVKYRERSAKRDVLKVLGIEPDTPLLEENKMAQYFFKEIAGMPRHLSIHSGGFTLSADPIIETVPIEPARMEGRTIVQWDKDDLDYIGLLKVDILALGMLTAIRKTLDLVQVKQPLELYTIPHDDLPTYQMIQRGETIGVFQIESRAQMGMLTRLKPEKFYDLVIEVAIVRPGPIVGEMVHPYLRRRQGLEDPQSPHPDLEPILGRTLGVPLFQEQVMQMSMVLAGFTPGEADQLRRAIGAWRSSGDISKIGMKLMEGLRKKNLPEDYIQKIFGMIQGFAEYGFPESHAASFALLAYASSYLKCHYPAEFTCALINSQPMGFYANHTLLEEAKRAGITLLPLHPAISVWDCTLEEGGLRLGFRMLHGLGEEACEKLIEERKKSSFKNLADFVWRTSSFLRPPVLHELAMGDAFACFGCTQRDALWEMLAIPKKDNSSQLDLFGILTEAPSQPSSQTLFPRLGEFETIHADYQAFGASVRGHPMKALRKIPGLRIPAVSSHSLKQGRDRSTVRIGGLIIVRQRPPTAKGTCFATLEDEDGLLDLVLHKSTYEKYRDVFVENQFLIVCGRLQKQGDSVHLIVSSIQKIENDFRVNTRDFH